MSAMLSAGLLTLGPGTSRCWFDPESFNFVAPLVSVISGWSAPLESEFFGELLEFFLDCRFSLRHASKFVRDLLRVFVGTSR